MTERETNSLAAHGLENFFPVVLLCQFFVVVVGNSYTCCKWAGETFFPVVLLCQFLVLVLHTYVLRVQYSCAVVSVFWFGRK